MLKKLYYKISVAFDTILSILLRILLTAIVICLLLAIGHNSVKMVEIFGENAKYKKVYPIDDPFVMNTHVYGENNEETLVILPAFGLQEPVLQYKGLAQALSDKYKVVVVDYYGYGYSTDVKKDRTNALIAEEIKTLLDQVKVYRYLIVAEGTSNLYAMEFANMYPEAVAGIITINGELPSNVTEEKLKQEYDDNVQNIKIGHYAEIVGFGRIMSYLKPENFGIKQLFDAGVYDAQDMSELRNRIACAYITGDMVEEYKNLYNNKNALYGSKYDSSTPVLQIISSDVISEYEDKVSNGDLEKNVVQYASDLISNEGIQKITKIDGEKDDLRYLKFKELGQIIKDFIEGTYSNYISADYKTSTKKPIETEKKVDSVVPVDNTVVPTTSKPKKEVNYTENEIMRIEDNPTTGPNTPVKSVPVTSDGKASRNETTTNSGEVKIDNNIKKVEVELKNQ
ncbi:MAG: alpha/beta hydrolase [Clostridia bacterium]|nr:alpha/beta hydrolase [Clostridia bacterium]